MIRAQLAALAVAAAVSTGCLDPQVSDEVPPKGLVLPAGSTVPDGHEDPDVDQQIADYDGVDGVIPRLSGFAEGGRTWYWDFGAAPEFAAPLFVLVRRNAADELELVEHNTIVGTIPGDPGYSPYWAVLFVEVTDAYDGQIIPSIAAVQEAQQLGLVRAPEPQPFAVNCPAVAADVTLEVGSGNPPLPPPSRFYWEGRTVRYYDFGMMPLIDGAVALEAPAYRLHREGQEPLSEPERGVDITGDSDTADTNNLFVTLPDDTGYTMLCRIVEVAVPAGYASIDTSGDETIADFRSSADVFNPDPVPGNVVAFEATDTLWNCPQQRAGGAL